MEISITWNICRVCLQEETKNDKDAAGGQMRDIFDSENKLAEKIYECSGVLMKPNDSLPEKICRKCIAILKYAIHFRKSCRDSDVYLQSVMQRTKSASSLFKQDRGRDALVQPLVGETKFDCINDADDLMSLAEGSDSTGEQPKQENNHRTKHKRKQNHNILIQENKRRKEEELSPSSCGKEYITQGVLVAGLEYDAQEHDDTNENIITHENEEEEQEDVVVSEDEIIENPDDEEANQKHQNSENSPITHKDTMFVHESDQEYDDDQDDKELRPELYDTQAPFTKLGSQLQESNVINCGESDDEVVDHEEASNDSTELITLKSEDNTQGLYYIINKDHSSSDEQANAIEDHMGSDDNVDFVPLGEDEELHHHHIEHEDDNVDNQSQVTSTVVTKEEIDIEDASSNLSRNTHEIDAEYIVDEYVVDDYGGPHNTLLHPNGRTIVKNHDQKARKFSLGATELHVRRAPIAIGRKNKAGPLYAHVESSTTTLSQQPQQVTVCDICGNHFTNRQLMNAHMKIHRQEKAHECELCFKRFITACNLQAHMRIHTGEKPFECKFCGRRFTDRSTHLRHERIHTNEKPFSCEHCGKSFALATTLQAHLKVHTGERPYRCEPCAKSFKLPHQLKAHQNTHLHKAVERSVS